MALEARLGGNGAKVPPQFVGCMDRWAFWYLLNHSLGHWVGPRPAGSEVQVGSKNWLRTLGNRRLPLFQVEPIFFLIFWFRFVFLFFVSDLVEVGPKKKSDLDQIRNK